MEIIDINPYIVRLDFLGKELINATGIVQREA
jgi:hypothetical protein